MYLAPDENSSVPVDASDQCCSERVSIQSVLKLRYNNLCQPIQIKLLKNTAHPQSHARTVSVHPVEPPLSVVGRAVRLDIRAAALSHDDAILQLKIASVLGPVRLNKRRAWYV